MKTAAKRVMWIALIGLISWLIPILVIHFLGLYHPKTVFWLAAHSWVWLTLPVAVAVGFGIKNIPRSGKFSWNTGSFLKNGIMLMMLIIGTVFAIASVRWIIEYKPHGTLDRSEPRRAYNPNWPNPPPEIRTSPVQTGAWQIIAPTNGWSEWVEFPSGFSTETETVPAGLPLLTRTGDKTINGEIATIREAATGRVEIPFGKFAGCRSLTNHSVVLKVTRKKW